MGGAASVLAINSETGTETVPEPAAGTAALRLLRSWRGGGARTAIHVKRHGVR